MAPIHHHFELKGWPETKVVIRFWIIRIIIRFIFTNNIQDSMNKVEKNISEIKKLSISVIGLGRSGIAIAHLANHLGSKVFISDNSSSDSVMANLQSLESIGIQGEIGGCTDKIYNCDLMVISPGIPADSQIIIEAQRRGIRVIGEIEFASLFTNSPINRSYRVKRKINYSTCTC